jgi:hypothetical protein
LLQQIKTEERTFDFDRIIAYPRKYKNMDALAEQWDPKQGGTRPKDGYNSGGYEWCIEHWGTKWNATDVVIEDDGSSDDVVFHFSTAWSPPEPVIQELSRQHPDLTFDLRYFESGMGFNGMLVCDHGEVTGYGSGNYYGERGG